MGAVELRNTILDKLNTIEDSSVLVKVSDYVEHIQDSNAKTSNVTEARLDEIDAMRANYMAGKGKHFT